MANNPYREQLLADAIKAQRGATRKISRLKTKVDVIVAGTEFDPRKPVTHLKRLTNRQLEVQLSRTRQFNDRSVQFVPDAHHRPIPAAEWKDYKRAEAVVVAKAKAQLDKVRDIPTSNPNETIGQRRDKMRSDRKLAGNPTVQDPYSPRERTSNMVASRAALKILTKEEKRKAKPGWDKKELNRQIGEFSRMAAAVGDSELEDAVKKLTPGQFRALWNDSNFATAMGIRYEQHQHGLVSAEDKPWHAQLIKDAFVDARREVDWAKNLDL